MATERPPQKNQEVLRAEKFLERAYGDVTSWLQEARSAQIIRTFEPERIREWETQSTYPPASVTLALDLEKAIVLKDDRNTYGLALGGRSQSRYDIAGGPSLQFGFLPDFDWEKQEPFNNTDIGKLRLLVGPSAFHDRRGEFYFRTDIGKLLVDCWINSRGYGGRDIGRWDTSAITPEGREAVLNTVKRLVRNFDPV